MALLSQLPSCISGMVWVVLTSLTLIYWHILMPLLSENINFNLFQLTDYVVLKKRSTQCFPKNVGIIQGDTLSPLIFLTPFNPITQLTPSLATICHWLPDPSTWSF